MNKYLVRVWGFGWHKNGKEFVIYARGMTNAYREVEKELRKMHVEVSDATCVRISFVKNADIDTDVK